MINTRRLLKGVSLIFIIFFGNYQLFSQDRQQYKLLRGEIVSDSLNISGIHVINKSSGAKSITDSNGLFSVGVKINDTIVISSVQTKPKIIIVNSKIFIQDLIKIYPEPFVNQLDNVVVRPHNLTGNLFNDMKDSGIKKSINFDDVGVPGFKGERAERIVYKNDTQVLLNVLLLPIMPINIEGVYKQLSGYYDDLKKTRVLDKQFNVVFQAIQFYGVAFFMKNYNLNEDEVYEFVLGAFENSEIENDFLASNHNLVIESFNNFSQSINEK